MLTIETKDKIEAAMMAVRYEGYTFCGFAISPDTAEIQPFGNNDVVPEFIFNLIQGAALIADGMYDSAPISEAAEKFFKQAQLTKPKEA